MKNANTGEFEIGPLPDGLGGPYSTATEFYRAWAAKNMNLPESSSDFPFRINCISACISQYDRGPFRLIHGDFGDHNILVDEDFNLRSVIDWEKSFVGPAEMAASFPLRLLVYPEALVPTQKDAEGKVMGTWKATFDDREKYVSAIEAHEHGEAETLSSFVLNNRLQEDVIFLIKRWNDKAPWMYNYIEGLRDKIEMVLSNVQNAR